jgi:transcriptional regulator with XRE-family HTH domain
MSSKELGKLIKAARERLGLSQQQLADLTGWSRPFISMLEIGTASERNLENTIEKLAQVLREDEDRLRDAVGLRATTD